MSLVTVTESTSTSATAHPAGGPTATTAVAGFESHNSDALPESGVGQPAVSAPYFVR